MSTPSASARVGACSTARPGFLDGGEGVALWQIQAALGHRA
ncbi:hypothetical protein [Haloechinothrix sp. LS1_15]|nr:hypothetical protein [Haloechinothrix sp. LS1_15]